VTAPTDPSREVQRVLTDAFERFLGATVGADQMFRAIFDGAFEFIGLLSPDGRLLEANRTSLEFVGMRRPEVLGGLFWDMPWWSGSAETRNRLRAAMAAVAKGAFVRHEVEITGRDGRVAAIDLSLKPLASASGTVELVLAEGRDITERRRADTALREHEERFTRIISIAADAIISIDESQRITLFNHGAETIFGYAAAEMLGQPLGMLLPVGAADAHRRHVVAFGSSGDVARRMGERGQIFGRRKSGEVFPAEASISSTEVGGQRIYTAVLRDVTARWVAEDEKNRLLATAQAARDDAESAGRRLSVLLEVSALLSESLNLDTTLRNLAHFLVSELATFCIIDIVEDDGRHRRLHVVHADPAKQEIANALLRFPRDPNHPFLAREALRTGRIDLMRELTSAWLEQFTSDPEHLDVLRALDVRSCICVPLIARGRTVGAVALVRDGASPPYAEHDLGLVEALGQRAALAVDNARLYEEAQRAVRSRDEVLGIVSHDLRNPLSVISMCAAALTEEASPKPGNVGEIGEMMRESADWMQRLIADLLDVASIERGRLSLDPRAIDPVVLVAKAVDMLEHAAREAGVEIALDVPETLPKIQADPDRVLQVFANLLGNAIKFSAAGSRITIGADVEDGAVHFFVRDSGPGISAEHLPRIFDRFWQARATARVRGSGLGLAIAKGIVEGHGGRIWVESTVGAGSTFRFTLPLAAAPVNATPTLRRPAPERNAEARP
jgi:PAS domain S-box-containing protein